MIGTKELPLTPIVSLQKNVHEISQTIMHHLGLSSMNEIGPIIVSESQNAHDVSEIERRSSIDKTDIDKFE